MRRWIDLPVAVFARRTRAVRHVMWCLGLVLALAGLAPTEGALAAPARDRAKPAASTGKKPRGKAAAKAAPPTPAALAPAIDLYDPSGAALGRWGAAWKLAARKKGTARALFWGASHTAADFWTGHLRRLWQERSDEVGHGYVFPVRFHLGYRHTDLNLTSSPGWQVVRYQPDQPNQLPLPLDVGMQGVLATSSDPNDFCELRTTTDNPNGRSWQLVEVWAQGRPDGGNLRIEHEGPDGTEVTILPTQGSGLRVATIRAADTPHRLRLSPVGDGPVSLYGTVLERDRPGVVLDQMGIPGMRASVWLKWAEQPLVEQIRRRRPDLIVLAYGTNDVGDADEPIATYLANWRQVLNRMRKAAPDVSCILVGPTDRLSADAQGVKRTMPRTQAVIDAQRQVAREFGCAHFDAFAAMGGGMAAWQRAKLAQGDDVHLTKLGYEAMAVQLDEAITRHVAAADKRAAEAKRKVELEARKAHKAAARPHKSKPAKPATKAKRR